MNESFIKYLAGLLDADGCLTLQLRKSTDGARRCYLKLSLYAETTIDRHGFIDSLPTITGMGVISKRDDGKQLGSTWEVQKIEHLNMILPRLTKHMVIKAKHWKRLHDLFLSLRGTALSERECDALRAASKESRRLDAGPLKPKNHPTWAWVAGFMDGDGHYTYKVKHKYQKGLYDQVTLRMGATLHKGDVVALELLQKAFGGQLYNDGHLVKWHRNLGPSDSSFAVQFLSRVVQHARLKKHKIESILSYHNQLQRLNEHKPTG